MNCPDCGIPVAKDASFCPKCYARIEPPGLLRRIADFFTSHAKPGVHVLKSEKTVTITTMDKHGNRHEYKSVKEVPLAQRAQLERMEAEVKQDEAELLSAQILEAAKGTPGVISKKAFVVYKIKDATGQERIYHSLDEVPLEMRARIEKASPELMKQAGLLAAEALEEAKDTPGTLGQKKFVVYKTKDVSGQEHTYHTLEELPPHIREAIERLKGTGGSIS